MGNKYVMLSLDDEKTGHLADALNNKTCRKILSYLAENEATEAEISKSLGLPANTVNYDIKKLLDAGLIEKSGSFFWSVKGKKMPKYKVSNKSIVISPKNFATLKSLGITAVLTGVAAFFVKVFSSTTLTSVRTGDTSNVLQASEKAVAAASDAAPLITSSPIPEIWLWFLLGGITSLLIYMLVNWKKL